MKGHRMFTQLFKQVYLPTDNIFPQYLGKRGVIFSVCVVLINCAYLIVCENIYIGVCLCDTCVVLLIELSVCVDRNSNTKIYSHLKTQRSGFPGLQKTMNQRLVSVLWEMIRFRYHLNS